ncbi:hypothetical protein AMJ47_01325 [Parcubacteria bacterium DG_72]|nr:MAG: hypothetical protein AMJ47_01325 [Parcubacteria bacterium DG_72]
MKSEAAKLRMNDLKNNWPSSALRRRMQLDHDMELALAKVGCDEGLHCSCLRWDELVIQGILKNRKLN